MSSRVTVFTKADLRKAAAASFAALLSLSALRAESLGVLEIRSLPEVDVVWEGVFLGQTDTRGLLAVEGIPFGDYSVTFRKAGYRDSTPRIDVNRGEKTVFLLQMETEIPEPMAVPESLAGPGWETNPTGAATEPRNVAPEPGTLAPEPLVPAPVQPLAQRQASATERAPIIGSPWLLLAAALGGAALAFTIRRRKRPKVAPVPETPQPIPVTGLTAKQKRTDWRATDPAFLEDLKRREQALDHRPPPWSEDEVIDVEATEIRHAEGKS